TVVSPAPRSSHDCENAASALLDLSTDRAAAWKGKYTAWNMETQGDVWPGDVLAVSATSADLAANLVVRAVEIRTTSTVPADVWLPQQPQATVPLDNLAKLTFSVSSSAITVDAGTVPPANGGFEVRHRDWDFGPGTDSDLVLRSPVKNFTVQ